MSIKSTFKPFQYKDLMLYLGPLFGALVVIHN